MSKASFFSEFRNLYELTKTLRFELRPTKETEELFKEILWTPKWEKLNLKDFFSNDALKNEHKKTVLKEIDLHVFLPYIQNALNEKQLLNIDFETIYKQLIDIEGRLNKETKPDAKKKIRSEKLEIINKLWSEISKNFINAEKICGSEALNLLKEYFEGELKNADNNEEEYEKIKGKLEILKEYWVWYFNLKGIRLAKFVSNIGNNWQIYPLKKGSISERVVSNFQKFIRNIKNYNYLISLFSIEWLIIDEQREKIRSYSDLFTPNYYRKTILQKDIDSYNKKLWELRSSNFINAINQKIKSKEILDSEGKVISEIKLINLDKQILGDVIAPEYDKIEDENDFLEKLNIFKIELNSYLSLKWFFDEFFQSLENSSISNEIYLKDQEIKKISWKYFKDYNFLIHAENNKNWIEKLSKKNMKKWKDQKISLATLFKTLDKKWEEEKDLSMIIKSDYYKKLTSEDIDLKKAFLSLWKGDVMWLFEELEQHSNFFMEKWENFTDKESEELHDFCETGRRAYMFIDSFFPVERKKEGAVSLLDLEEEQNDFYSKLSWLIQDSQIISLYNQFRNYISKKPYSIEKINVKFGNDDLLNWWTLQEKGLPYMGAIFKDWERFFLGVLLKKLKQFNNMKYEWWEFYQFMKYSDCDYAKVIKNQYKNIFWKALSEIKFDEISKKENEKIAQDVIEVIDQYAADKFPAIKQQIVDKKDSFLSTAAVEKTFKESLTYKIEFQKVSKKDIHAAVKNWDLLLFEIYSKDFSDKSNWRKNLNTLFFQEIFSERNLKLLQSWDMSDNIFALSWGGNIFFREESIKKENITKRILSSALGKENGKEVINNKRFSEEKLLFHVPININYWKQALLPLNNFNDKINSKLLSWDWPQYFIGIDRWEKFLWYAVVIDRSGKIMESIPLNWPDGKYKELLVAQEKKMMEWRKNWKTIGKIKDLKEWYISWVVHIIVELLKKYDKSVIVLENLNTGFKDLRKKIDRQVYNKLEYWILKKLNYICEKSSVDKWVQLTPYFYDKSLTKDKIDASKQLWIVFYINPAYTSQVCPNCWFMKSWYGINVDTKLEKIERQLKDKIKEIVYMKEKDVYKIFFFNIDKTKTITLFSSVDRLKRRRKTEEKKRTTEEFNLTEQLFSIFGKEEWNLFEKFLSSRPDLTKLRSLWECINTLIQLRNSNTESEALKQNIEIDFISCPHCLYDSRKIDSINESWKRRNISFLKNADANGAYHIAIKWKIMVDNINKNCEENSKEDIDPDPKLSDFIDEMKKIFK